MDHHDPNVLSYYQQRIPSKRGSPINFGEDGKGLRVRTWYSNLIVGVIFAASFCKVTDFIIYHNHSV